MSPLPDIEQIIDALLYQVAAGTAHLVVAKGLAESDPVVLNAARTFFAMTIDAHISTSLLYAARMHDDQRNAVTIRTLLDRVSKEINPPKYGTLALVKEQIDFAEGVLAELKEPLKHIDKVRNRRLAHTDPQTLQDPMFAMREITEDAHDLGRIFTGIGIIINRFSGLYRSIYGEPKILDQTDYETVVGFVSDAKCAQARNYEKEFGKPAPFPRPKNCQ
jgi:hypothetical protein